MKVIIVDDEQAPAKVVQKMLHKNFPTFDVCGIYYELDEAIEGINKYQPDLVFLDVELKGGKTGFDLLEKISPRSFEVIFITAYDKFAARAFQYSALHFIQKPVDLALFTQAVNRAIDTKKTKDFTQRFDVLLDGIRTEHKLPQKIMVPNLKSDGWLCLKVSNIVRVDSDSKHMVRMTYEEKGKYLYTGVKKSIGETERMLEGHDFLRIHESHLVNLNYVESFQRNQKTIIMSDNVEVEVSRRNINLLTDKIKKL